MEKMTVQQAKDAMENGEFGKDLVEASDKVAVILTQSWCPQWKEMREYAHYIDGAALFYLEYDKTDFFDEFRAFKEETLGNDQIPYVRYYRGGRLVAQSNFVPETTFRANLTR